MAPPIHNPLWTRRWNTVRRLMDTTQARLRRESQNRRIDKLAASFGDHEAIIKSYLIQNRQDSRDLLKSLKANSNRLFNFFHNQLSRGKRKTKYPLNYVLKTLLQQTSIDLDNIQRAYDQRFVDALGQDKFNTQILTLIIADSVARFSIRPAIEAGLLGSANLPVSKEQNVPQDIAILSFLNDRIMIRVLPYCDAILMGVPFSAFAELSGEDEEELLTISIDYLAIPHEAGHILFRHGQVQREKDGPRVMIQELLRERLLTKVHRRNSNLNASFWLFHWLEEFFADTYGCFIAGSAAAASFQHMLGSGLPSHPQDDFDKHPTPMLRPLIYRLILDKLYPDEKEENARQEQEWCDWVKENWGIEDLKERIYLINGREFSGLKVLQDIEPLINIVTEGLQEWIGEAKNISPGINWADWTRNDDGTVSALLNSSMVLNALEGVHKSDPDKKLVHEQIAQMLKNEPNLDIVIEHILFRGWSDEGGEANHLE